MQNLIAPIVVHYLVSEIVSLAAGANPAELKGKVNARIATFASTLHLGFATPEMQAAADAIVDGALKLLQDDADLKALLSSLAGKDLGAAAAALKTLLLKVSGGDVAALLSAA